ncbi:hypothetical protein [Methylobacterium sp. E-045]|uniref:hypothetical protein n=1 Tax=Methylobacterium sp. E-045 TaxID=2836575 RepID=UPI001FBB2E54|nr:hypothetical protein [Methylobacterium sp. E-045]MCJ2127296.1 hypothetical protein [Methylobacterium sp. E-045]
MTPREQAAYLKGIRDARQMAMIAAVTIEARDDHREVRQQAASAALHGLAEGLKQLLLRKPTTGECRNERAAPLSRTCAGDWRL